MTAAIAVMRMLIFSFLFSSSFSTSFDTPFLLELSPHLGYTFIKHPSYTIPTYHLPYIYLYQPST